TDGTAAQFDGNDILRSFEDLSLPATERTIALWFNTTCANCGLFSSVQGDFPTLTEHDHDIFLDAGKGGIVSFITGPASRELRCSVANSYNDGQWHQIVHTLGDNGNSLYLDGELAVSSPTTGSTFTRAGCGAGGVVRPRPAIPYFTVQARRRGDSAMATCERYRPARSASGRVMRLDIARPQSHHKPSPTSAPAKTSSNRPAHCPTASSAPS
ncbi:MAG: hypothetical protein IPL78_00740, partial [Chloroflexi bacterium]|nr:hypothetical protein [Chloroflexota bacterium]